MSQISAKYIKLSAITTDKIADGAITAAKADASLVKTSQLAVVNGIATLDSSGKVPASQLPSYVDDVLEYSALSSFPQSGETGKIYVALDSNKAYRWSGSTYIEVSPSEVNSVNGKVGVVSLNTGDISEGSNLYFTNARAKAAAVANNITSGVTDVAPSQDAVYSKVQQLLALDGSRAMSGSLNLNSNKIINLADPTAYQDAASKAFVDQAGGTKAISASTTLVPTDGRNIKTGQSSAITITMPNTSGLVVGMTYTIANRGTSGNVTVVGSAGATLFVVPQNQIATVRVISTSGTQDLTAAWAGYKWMIAALSDGSFNVGTGKLTNIGNGSASSDAAAIGQVMLLSGAQAMSGDMNLGSHYITNLHDPQNDQDAATKKFVTDQVSAEATSRASADSALSSRIGVLEADPTTKSYVDAQVSAEASARSSAVSAEQSARQAQDGILDGKITQEISDRQAAISAEQSARVAGDAQSLSDAKAYADQKITNLINGAPGALDTLKEIADQLANDESAVSALTNTVASNLQTAKDYADAAVLVEKNARISAVSSEQSDRQSADSALSSRISALEADPTTQAQVDLKLNKAGDTMSGNLNMGGHQINNIGALFLAGDVDMGSHRIASLHAPVGLDDAVRLRDLETRLRLDGSDAMAANLSMGSHKIVDLAAPSDDHDAVHKLYLEGRISDVLGAFVVCKKETFTLSADDVSNGYVDLAFAAEDKSVNLLVKGAGIMLEGDDFTLSLVGGVTRVSFAGDLASGGNAALADGDKIQVMYRK